MNKILLQDQFTYTVPLSVDIQPFNLIPLKAAKYENLYLTHPFTSSH